MYILQRLKSRLSDGAAAISPTCSIVSIDGSRGRGLCIGSVEGDGK